MKKQKILKIVGMIVLLSFVIYNVIWFANWNSYNKYKNSVGYEADTKRYFCTDSEGCRYAVFAPNYLSFVGNLTVGNNIWEERGEQTTCSLIIWPLFMGGYEFGVNLYVPLRTDDELVYKSYSFVLDENGNSISDELTEDEKKMLDENTEVIKKMYKKAYEMWQIGKGK